ncbi:enterotoxin 1 [Escherichia coli]|nr:enterotoxin 1 [Escherichia coli]
MEVSVFQRQCFHCELAVFPVFLVQADRRTATDGGVDNRMPLEYQGATVLTQGTFRQVHATIKDDLSSPRQLWNGDIHIPGQLTMKDNGLFCPPGQDPVFYCLNCFVFVRANKFPLSRVIQTVPPQGVTIAGRFQNIEAGLAVEYHAVQVSRCAGTAKGGYTANRNTDICILSLKIQ